MIDGLDEDVAGADEAAARRDEVAAAVRDHASQIARELSLLQGGDYGQRSFDTDRGTWTLKYEAGDVQYLRFERGSREIYVVSSKQPPEPSDLATAMVDYDAFVESFNDYVDSVDSVLDDVQTGFPEIAATEHVVAERDRIVGEIREYANQMAGELHRYEGTNYGTFQTRVDGTRWELKWEDGQVTYLRVNGSDGIYLISQYEPPSARDLRAHVGGFRQFVEAFNDHVTDLSAELSTVSL